MIGMVRDSLKVSFRGDMFAAEDVLALIAWAAPEQVERALVRGIDALPVRPTRCPPLNASSGPPSWNSSYILELERWEEALIERAAADGVELRRRPDASPLAVLNITIAQAQQVA
jgi:hypothetical protein